MILDLTALRNLLLLTLILTGCAAPLKDSRPLATELTNQRLDRLQQEQQDLSRQLLALENQLRQLQEQLRNQPAVNTPAPYKPTEMVTPASQKAELDPLQSGADPAAGAGASPTDIYLKAFTDYASGRFDEAIIGFRRFIERFPHNDFSGNAQFWLGECYYSQRQLNRALTEFSLVAEQYPDSNKAPDALLKMAGIYQELNQPDRQRQTTTRLLDGYPQSGAAKKLRAEQPD